MTVIHPNSISGITSVTSHSNSLYLYESDHSTKLTINAHVNGNTSGTASNLTGSPSINVTNITASGNVSIGGTLTYEDVTNIDSVGIITAQSNVVIADKIIHLGDTNTALRFPANNTFTVETSGSEAFRVDSSQRLLIGTTSEINSSTASNFQIANASGPRLCIARNDTSTASGNLIGALDFYGNDSDGTYENCARILAEADADHTTDSKLTRLTFYTAGSDPDVPEERLRIDSSGRLLVGTSSALTGSNSQYSFVQNIGNSFGSTTPGYMSLGRSEVVTSMANNDPVGRIFFTDNAAATFAYIEAAVDNNPGTNDYPGRLTFLTTADGASSPTERLRIDSSGRLLQGKTATKGSTGENVPTFCNEITSNNPNILEIANNGTATNAYACLVLSRSDSTSVNGHTAVCLLYTSDAADE